MSNCLVPFPLKGAMAVSGSGSRRAASMSSFITDMSYHPEQDLRSDFHLADDKGQGIP